MPSNGAKDGSEILEVNVHKFWQIKLRSVEEFVSKDALPTNVELWGCATETRVLRSRPT